MKVFLHGAATALLLYFFDLVVYRDWKAFILAGWIYATFEFGKRIQRERMKSLPED